MNWGEKWEVVILLLEKNIIEILIIMEIYFFIVRGNGVECVLLFSMEKLNIL